MISDIVRSMRKVRRGWWSALWPSTLRESSACRITNESEKREKQRTC